MDTSALKPFAQEARRTLRELVSARLVQVLAEGSAARREAGPAVRELEGEIAKSSRDQVVERVAYTWFNRFCALRFMDANGYTGTRVVSPAEGQTRPEILAEAAAGVIGEYVPEAIAAQVRALLDNRAPSRDPQGEAYRLLVVASCNHWHGAMPFMFEKIADYTELLMPEDLLSANSLLARMRAVMTEEACTDVEISGWLYQFYISEKKDEVFSGLKKNQKITPTNIPAATQLFTPHWIVRYLVENSLGRLWLLNRPASRLRERMEYYIAPETPEADFPRITRPEEIKICDPACGSGHMLTYAFDLLRVIYEEEGYDAAEIPGLILMHNLFGIEIDDRAGALAAFALTMKARGAQRRFFRWGVAPNICVLENVVFESREVTEYAQAVGADLFTKNLREMLTQFTEANNFGSLIRPAVTDVAEVRRVIATNEFERNLFLRHVHGRVQTLLRMADYLSARYHIVLANPPYMGGKGMNPRLKRWLADNYPSAKSDLMTCFMERCYSMTLRAGFWSMINLPSWMFLGSYDGVRDHIVSRQSIRSLLHLGRGLFGPDFGTVAFVIQATPPAPNQTAIYRRLFEGQVNVRKPEEIERLFFVKDYNVFQARQSDFGSIPGSPIAYWVTRTFSAMFRENRLFEMFFAAKQGLATGNNDRFLRFWFEVDQRRMDVHQKRYETFTSSRRWFPYSKGGEARKWYGNNVLVVNWENNGEDLKAYKDENGNRLSTLKNLTYQFRPAITWTLLSIGGILCCRLRPSGFVFDTNGMSAFATGDTFSIETGLSILNSKVAQEALKILNPTMAFQSGDIDRVPVPHKLVDIAGKLPTKPLIAIAKTDWDAYETSWDFSTLPLLNTTYRESTLAATWDRLHAHWRDMTTETQRLEEENNRIFLDAYGLKTELRPDVTLEEITLACNPAHRYGGKKSAAEHDELLRADTMREFLSYAVGCMFGRFSLDAPGLILANQGDGMAEYLAQTPNPSFTPVRDSVIPLLDRDWFASDITERFRIFLRVTFGEDRLQENLAFVEEALGKDIRKYFTRDFFNDHIKRYKRRPIYWLFASPQGTFQALIYMHRYSSDTVGVVLNDYLRELRNRLEAHRRSQEALNISPDASQGQKTKALTEIDTVGKQIQELDTWERDVLFPLASKRIEIELDDGVKANYPKFGAALKPIKGLNDAED